MYNIAFHSASTPKWTNYVIHSTSRPEKQDRVFLAPSKKLLVQCTLQKTRTLNKSRFTRYQKYTAMYSWSPCSTTTTSISLTIYLYTLPVIQNPENDRLSIIIIRRQQRTKIIQNIFRLHHRIIYTGLYYFCAQIYRA